MTRTERLVLAIAILASVVVFLDGSVINVALPAMSKELGGGLAVQQWIVDAYLITLGSLILLAGSLSDVYGRWLILRVGLIGFGVTSIAIALAPTAELLIITRGLQGIAGALLVPSSLAIILSTFRGPAQAKAIGLWTAWTSAGFLAGPLMGGLFVDFLSWRLVFAINVIPIAITLVLIAVLGTKDERTPGRRIDYLGAVLGVLGLGGPVFALIEQGNYGWGSPVILIPFIGGLIAFAAFLWWQRIAPQPMLPLSLFRVRNFWVGNIATLLIYGALSIASFAIAVFLQEVAGFPATLAGLAFIPVSIANIALSSFFGAWSGRVGPRWFMTLGPIVAAIGFLLMLGMDASVNYVTDVLPGIVLFAIGLSATVAPLTAAILGAVSMEQSGIGSATNNAVSRVAGLVAIAMLGLIVGEALTVASFHRVLIVIASLMVAGGLVSFAGIRKPIPPSRDFSG